jgi:hypothetical protein
MGKPYSKEKQPTKEGLNQAAIRFKRRIRRNQEVIKTEWPPQGCGEDNVSEVEGTKNSGGFIRIVKTLRIFKVSLSLARSRNAERELCLSLHLSVPLYFYLPPTPLPATDIAIFARCFVIPQLGRLLKLLKMFRYSSALSTSCS